MPESLGRAQRRLKDRKALLRLLRQVRNDAHLRQADVAKVLGTTQGYVSKYELGERRLDLLDLSAVCDATSISLVEFVKRFQEARRKS
jgi:transcriptional regulator with XRE-family HTH domain